MALDVNHVDMHEISSRTVICSKTRLFSPASTLEIKKNQRAKTSFLINDMSPSAPIMAAGSSLIISIQTGQVNRSAIEPTQGPTAGELTRSRPNMLVSALVSLWLTVACIGSGTASNAVPLICQQAAIYNRWPLLIGQAVCQWTSKVVRRGGGATLYLPRVYQGKRWRCFL